MIQTCGSLRPPRTILAETAILSHFGSSNDLPRAKFLPRAPYSPQTNFIAMGFDEMASGKATSAGKCRRTHALQCAAHGLRVLPLHWIVKAHSNSSSAEAGSPA